MSGAPPRGRWLHAHLRECAVQVWFQNEEGGDPPECTCVTNDDNDGETDAST